MYQKDIGDRKCHIHYGILTYTSYATSNDVKISTRSQKAFGESKSVNKSGPRFDPCGAPVASRGTDKINELRVI